jgi:replicative DNA helicase
MFVFREEYYLQRRDPASLKSEQVKTLDASRNIAEVIIAKYRWGPIGRVGLFFDARLTRFLEPRNPNVSARRWS